MNKHESKRETKTENEYEYEREHENRNGNEYEYERDSESWAENRSESEKCMPTLASVRESANRDLRSNETTKNQLPKIHKNCRRVVIRIRE